MNAIRYLPFVGRPLIGLDAASEMIEKSRKIARHRIVPFFFSVVS